MDSSIVEIILSSLRQIEHEQNVKILYAVESGSRSWGFESPDSDYDVRFIYAHEPDWYLSIQEGKDTVEQQGSQLIDIAGWDIRKALRLFHKSNPVLIEWLVSPIIYLEIGSFARKLRKLARKYYSKKAVASHYLSMAVSNHRAYFNKRTKVRLKKYLYVVRPLLNVLWLRENDGIVPMSLLTTVKDIHLTHEVRQKLQDLLVAKRQTPEMGMGARIAVLDSFIDNCMQKAADFCKEAPFCKPPLRAVDVLLRQTLYEIKTLE